MHSCNVPLSACNNMFINTYIAYFCVYTLHSCIHAMFLPLLVCDTCGKLPFFHNLIALMSTLSTSILNHVQCSYLNAFMYKHMHAMFSPLLVCDTCGKLPSRRDTSAGRDANLANFNVSARTYKSSHKDLKYQKWYFASLDLSNFPNSQCMF